MMIKCTDFYGKEHSVPEEKLVDRLSAYGIYISDGKILLIQDPRSLRWEIPGGGIEKNESISAGLSREVNEETGANITGPIEFLTEWNEYYFDITTNQGWRSRRKFYIVDKVDGELLINGNNDDSSTAKMIEINNLDSLKITPKIRKVIIEADEQLESTK